jgi:hypothetical protein
MIKGAPRWEGGLLRMPTFDKHPPHTHWKRKRKLTVHIVACCSLLHALQHSGFTQCPVRLLCCGAACRLGRQRTQLLINRPKLPTAAIRGASKPLRPHATVLS